MDTKIKKDIIDMYRTICVNTFFPNLKANINQYFDKDNVLFVNAYEENGTPVGMGNFGNTYNYDFKIYVYAFSKNIDFFDTVVEYTRKNFIEIFPAKSVYLSRIDAEIHPNNLKTQKAVNTSKLLEVDVFPFISVLSFDINFFK